MSKIKFDFSRLTKEVLLKKGSVAEFAKEVNISKNRAMCLLLNESPWKQEEIEKACEVLNIAPEFVNLMFFTSIA